jgi:hypothetical protein
MKQINNQKSEVYISSYDDNETLLPVDERYKGIENICVAVKFGDIVIKISPEDTCECSWYEAMEKHKEELMSPAFWQMVGNVYHKVNQALEMLGHEPIGWVWTDNEDNDPQYSGNSAWYYNGTYGTMYAYYKYRSHSVRATKVFKIKE